MRRGPPHRPPGSPLLAVAVADYAGLEAAIDGGAGAVYFGGLSYRGRSAWSLGTAARAVDLCRSHNVRAYLIIPRIWKEGERPGVDEWLDAAVNLRVDGVVAGDLGGLALALQSGLETVTDLSIPVFNDLAIQLLLRQGAARLTLSPELNREQLRNLCFRGAPCLELVVHGTLPLMVSEHCPVGAATQPGTRPECPDGHAVGWLISASGDLPQDALLLGRPPGLPVSPAARRALPDDSVQRQGTVSDRAPW